MPALGNIKSDSIPDNTAVLLPLRRRAGRDPFDAAIWHQQPMISLPWLQGLSGALNRGHYPWAIFGVDSAPNGLGRGNSFWSWHLIDLRDGTAKVGESLPAIGIHDVAVDDDRYIIKQLTEAGFAIE